MPKRKSILFVISIVLLAGIMILSVVMNLQYYEKTILISPEASENKLLDSEVGLEEIKRQLSEFREDETTGQILWSGSVCMTRYTSLGGTKTDYYICPYLVVSGKAVPESTYGECTLSLRFAMCKVRKDRLVSGRGEYALRQISLNCSTGNDIMIMDAAYNDMDVVVINKNTLENQFREKEKLTADTEIFARLTLASAAEANSNEPAPASLTPKEPQVLTANWAFLIEENGHLVNYFDGVQVEIPLEVK